jgi:primosomal protein N'
MQLMLKHPQRAPLHAALDQACEILDARRPAPDERWHVDVDPVEGV